VRASLRRIAELQEALFDERVSLSITGRTSLSVLHAGLPNAEPLNAGEAAPASPRNDCDLYGRAEFQRLVG
jgi:hypothetical protein